MISLVQRQILKSRKISNIFIDSSGNRCFSSDKTYQTNDSDDDRDIIHGN